MSPARRPSTWAARPSELNLVTLHLGNGASVAAVAGGRCIDTSMGMTPLEGLVMGTRSGDLDPAVVVYLHREAGLSVDDIDDLLNKRSGMLGLAGANDMREVDRLAAAGDEAAVEALDVYCYRIRKYVGAYAAALGRLDALVFTAGVGENNHGVRAGVCAGLEGLGSPSTPSATRAARAGPGRSRPTTARWPCWSSPPTRSSRSPSRPSPWSPPLSRPAARSVRKFPPFPLVLLIPPLASCGLLRSACSRCHRF